jgi:hypothetical protein
VIHRIAALVLAASLTTAAGLVVGSPASSGLPTINLHESISPAQGAPGTNISVNLDPGQAQSVCLNTTKATQQLRAMATQLLANPTTLAVGTTAVLAAVQSATLGNVAALYALAFADIATQAPIASKAPGWDPLSGHGTITAPNAKPGTYAVAAICLGLRVPSVSAVNAALGGLSPTDPGGAMAKLLTLAVDQDHPIGTGFALFCPTGPGSTGCAANAMVAQPSTAG